MSLEASLGVDIGSVSTKGVVLSRNNQILAKAYLWTSGSPIDAVKRTLKCLEAQIPKETMITSVGTTGSARKLIGVMLEADAIKNEITAHAIGTLSKYPEVKTILEIGGQDSKIILIENGVVKDYAMNTLCAAGTGAFLSSQAKRLDVEVEELGDIAISSKHPAKIAARCTVFAESDLVHKAQAGYKKEDLIAGLCHAVVSNYLNNVGKGKQIKTPIVFQGGVSKNIGVVQAFQTKLDCDILVDADSHLMGALGAAILSCNAANRKEPFEFACLASEFQTRAFNCTGCANQCEVLAFYRDDQLLDTWGHRCEKGSAIVEKQHVFVH